MVSSHQFISFKDESNKEPENKKQNTLVGLKKFTTEEKTVEQTQHLKNPKKG